MVTVTLDPNNKTKPYIIRGLYQWCVDQNFTPYIKVSVCPNTRVPHDYVQNGTIILNIDATATHKLRLENEDISFTGRFAGIAMEVWIPVRNVLAIFAKETGEGIMFQDSDLRVTHDWSPSKGAQRDQSGPERKETFTIVDPSLKKPTHPTRKRKSVTQRKKVSTFLKRVK